ncbi:hypothetical protein [Legionella sp. CNM-4043-24]|uniref:hypothetical protein n=1 Tax=Legionella sp. CNM-4043-24 TaxID=3421646 RepID=UPI00403AE3FE
MKKALLLSLGLGLSVSAQAEEFYCGYRDYFHLSNNTPASIFVINAYSNADMYVQVVGPRGFELRDTPRCVSGYAQVTVAVDAAHYCVLEIKDGPYMSSPTVSASCNQLTYKGIRYDGFNTYSYSLSFDY